MTVFGHVCAGNGTVWYESFKKGYNFGDFQVDFGDFYVSALA